MADTDSKPYGIVYCVLHRESGKRYIGQTTRSLAVRWRAHCTQDECIRLHRAIKRHGPDAFDVGLLASASAKADLDALEIFYIEHFGTVDRARGYNLRGGGSFGKHSAESRAKMAESVRKAYASTNLAARLSQMKMGHKPSAECAAKIAASNTGKCHTTQTREQMSALRARMWQDPTKRENMRQASIKARGSAEYKAEVAGKTKTQWQDPERRAKLLAAQAAGKAAFWADPEKRAARIAKRAATIEAKKSAAV